MSSKTLDIIIATKDASTATLNRVNTAFAGFRKNLSGMGADVSAATSAIRSLVLAYAGIEGFRRTADIIKESDQAIFNLQNSVGAANREFKNTGSVDDWNDAVRRLSGQLKIYTDTELRNAVSRTVDMTKRLGLERGQMEEVIKRSADLGAGKVELTDAIERVTAALRGEAEASEYLGLTLNETYVKGWYEAHRANETQWKDLNDLQKAQVRYRVLLDQTSQTQGRAAASADTFGGALAMVSKEIVNAIANNRSVNDSLRTLASVLRENAPGVGQFVANVAAFTARLIELDAQLSKILKYKTIILALAGAKAGATIGGLIGNAPGALIGGVVGAAGGVIMADTVFKTELDKLDELNEKIATSNEKIADMKSASTGWLGMFADYSDGLRRENERLAGYVAERDAINKKLAVSMADAPAMDTPPQALPPLAFDPEGGDDAAASKKSADQRRQLEKQLAADLVRISGDQWAVRQQQAKAYYDHQVEMAAGNQALLKKAAQVYAADMAAIDRDRQRAEADSIDAASLTRLQEKTRTALLILQGVFADGQTSVKDYFAERRRMIEDEAQAEIDILKRRLDGETDTTSQRAIHTQLLSREEELRRNLIQLAREEADTERQLADRKRETDKLMADLVTRASLPSSGIGLDSTFQTELGDLDARHAEELRRLEELKAGKDKIDEAYRLQKLEKDRLMADQEQRLNLQRLENAGALAGGLSDIFDGLYEISGKKNKELFYLSKAAAIAEATVNVAQAVTKALAQGGIWGYAQAGVLAAAGAVQIATISAQTLAKGGPVLGWSPHDRADNVPIMATADEYMIQRPTARYYGRRIMDAFNAAMIPRTAIERMLGGFAIPASRPAYALAAGGPVPAAASGGVGTPVYITNITDPREIDAYLATAQGQRAILNVMSRNSRRVQRIKG